MNPPPVWPQGKRFAFTVFDDTDSATLENVGGVYSFLADLGFRSTKSCWMFQGDWDRGNHPGQTCDDPDYRRWLLDLHAAGFEIGWHGATWHGVPRAVTIQALDRFAAVFGHDPRAAANHRDADEAMYWATARLSGLHALAYNVFKGWRNGGRYRGHVRGDPCFWGDVCQARVHYYRNFIFRDLNTLKACPWMPYHDPRRPYVNQWFAGSDGHDVRRFNRCLAEADQDRLEEEGGACIMYTHFARGFSAGGQVEPRFRALLERLARKNGWFVPVSTLLDHLRAAGGGRDITDAQRRRMERKWLLEKIFVGTT
ncbi:MAG: hypothetical protein ABSF26_13060 [Thermoguttaceae bacterium]|jgi:hypothetical protein